MREQLGMDVSAFNDRTYEDIVASALATPRFSSRVMSTFGVMALAFAGIALYSVLGFLVTSRRRELAIRLTLGADPRSLLASVLRHGIGVSIVGAAAGLVVGI